MKSFKVKSVRVCVYLLISTDNMKMKDFVIFLNHNEGRSNRSLLLSYIKVNLLIIIFDKEICIITKKLYIINMSHIFQETMDNKEKKRKKGGS